MSATPVPGEVEKGETSSGNGNVASSANEEAIAGTWSMD